MVPLLHSPAFLLVSELQRNIEELWPWAEEGDELVQTRRNIYWNDGGVVRVQMETLLVPSQWPRLSSSGVLTLFFRKEQVCAVLTPQTYGIRCCCLQFINCNCINLLMAFTISKGVVSWSLTAGWALTGTLLSPVTQGSASPPRGGWTQETWGTDRWNDHKGVVLSFTGLQPLKCWKLNLHSVCSDWGTGAAHPQQRQCWTVELHSKLSSQLKGWAKPDLWFPLQICFALCAPQQGSCWLSERPLLIFSSFLPACMDFTAFWRCSTCHTHKKETGWCSAWLS